MTVPRLSPSPDQLPQLDPSSLEQGSSLWHDAWIRLRKNHLAFASFWILIAIAALCYLGPFVFGADYASQNLDHTLLRPSWAHPFGTDDLGRDQLVRMMIGGRVSLG